MFYPVASAGGSIDLGGTLYRIDGIVDGGVADCVDGDLQARFVGRGDHRRQRIARPDRVAVAAVRIGLAQRSGAAVDRAVADEFDTRNPQHVALILLRQFRRARDLRQFLLQVAGPPHDDMADDARREFARRLQPGDG